MMKTIAVCGYSSNVGKVFLERYKDEYKFVKIGRKEDSDIIVDLRSCCMSGKIELLYGCDALVNLSAQTDDSTDEAILDLVRTNVVGALFLAEQVKKYNISMFVNVSSVSALYSNENAYYSFYAESKKSADAFLSHYCKINNIELCILRPSSIFGRASFSEHQKLLYGFASKIMRDEDIYINGTNDALRNYVHVETVCDVLAGVVENSVVGIYNVVNRENCKLTDLIKKIDGVLNKHTNVFFSSEGSNVIDAKYVYDSEVFTLTNVEEPIDIEIEMIKGIW